MPLQLSGQNIETPAGDSGTYTWADVVALGSTLLTAHTETSGKPMYRWSGTIFLRGTATLNILNITLEWLSKDSTNKGRIVTEDSAVVNFGQVATVNGQTVYRQGCDLIFTSAWNNSSISDCFLAYHPTSDTNTEGRINIYGCSLNFNFATNSRRGKIYISSLYSSYVWSTGTPSTSSSSERNVVSFQPNGIISSSRLLYSTIECNGAATLSDVASIIPQVGAVNYVSQQRIVLSGFNPSGPTSAGYLNTRSSPFDFDDSPNVNLANAITYRDDDYGTTTLNSRKRFSQYLKITDSGGSVSGVIVTYTGRTTATGTTGSDGLYSTILVTQETNLGGMTTPSNYSLYAQPVTVVDYSAYTLEVRSYLHLAVSESVSVAGTLGSSSQPFTRQLLLDSGVTQTNTVTVAGYSGVFHSSTTITISGSRSLAEVYDSRKLYWYNNGGTAPSRATNTADFGSLNITVSSGGISVSTAKFLDGIRTTGTVTLAGASSLSAPLQLPSSTVVLQSSGTYSFAADIGASATVQVTSGTTNLSTWNFTSGATIDNTSSSAALVYVDAAQVPHITTTSTGGGSVAVSAVPTYLSAANFAEGTRVQVVHRQVFIVASTAINTTTNAITLGNDSNGDAASLSTSTPRSLVRFALTSGATIPTTSPQIIDGGLYYVASNSAGVITLSITSGGSAIDFSSQGSGNFQLIAETELDNSLVGSSDYSLAIARSTGALIRVKARYWQNSSGCTASEFFDQVYVWSSTGGVTIADEVSVAALPDSIHNRIISISTLELPVSGSVAPTSDGSGVSGLTFALEGTGKIQINANDADGVLLIQDLYAWGVYISSTEAGIRLASASTFVADDLFNYQVMNLEFDNTGTIPLRIIGGRLVDDSGATPIASSTSASIFPNVELSGTGAIVSGGGATAADIWSYGTRSLTTTIPSASDNATAVWAADTRILTSGANIVLAKGVGITGLNDLALATIEGSAVLAKQSAVLAIPTNPLLTTDSRLNNLDAAVSSRSTHSVADVWAYLTASATTAGSLGKRIADNLDAAISTRLATSGYTAPDNTSITAIKAKTDNLPASPASVGDIPSASANASAVWSAGTRSLTTSFPAVPSASDNATAVWSAVSRTLTNLDLTTIEGSTVLAKQSAVLAIPTNPLLASNYTAPDNAGISTLLTRLSATRAGYLDLVPSIDSRTTDLSDLRGYTDGVTVTIDTTNGTITTSNGKRVRVSTSGLTRTIERDDP